MAIRVQCGQCGAVYNVPDERAGQVGRCRCGNSLSVPALPPSRAEVGPSPGKVPPRYSRSPEEPRSVGTTRGQPAEQEVVCSECGMQSRPGAECEWCRAPFRAPLPATRTAAHTGRAARSLSDAPVVVRVVRVLWLLPLVVTGSVVLAIVVWPLWAGTSSGVQDPALLIVWFSIMGGTWLVSLLLSAAIGRGHLAAWYVELVLLILGLVAFPVGTVLSGLILFFWLKPETRGWFGLE